VSEESDFEAPHYEVFPTPMLSRSSLNVSDQVSHPFSGSKYIQRSRNVFEIQE
jgi:hypothetical protein